MNEATPDSIPFPAADPSAPAQRDLLTQVLSNGAQQMLIRAVEAEIAQWIGDRHSCSTPTAIVRWSATATPRRARS